MPTPPMCWFSFNTGAEDFGCTLTDRGAEGVYIEVTASQDRSVIGHVFDTREQASSWAVRRAMRARLLPLTEG